MAQCKKTHIFLVDDDQSFHTFLDDLLDHSAVSLHHCTTGLHALEQLESRDFDLLLIDYQLPDMLGIEILQWLNSRGKDTPRVLVTGFATIPLAVEAMKLGASDVFCKPIEETDKFLRYLNRTLALDPPLPLSHPGMADDDCFAPAVSGCLSSQTREMVSHAVDSCPDLTARETEILEKIISGLSNKEIGAQLHISERTVKNHTSSVYRKFSVDSRPRLFLKVMQLSQHDS